MNAVHKLAFALALAFAAPVHADYLPDPAAAEAALWASPMVAQARGEFAAQTLKSQGLQRGHAEWAVSADVAQRRIQSPLRESQAEWGVALSRPLRLPAVAAADRTLAGALTAHAEANLGEALHESGRQLLALWFDWLNEASQAQLWQAQFQLAERQLDAVNSRIRLGEAPRAERVNAEAALAQIRLQQQQAGLRMQQAHSRLLAQFPALPLPPDRELPQPVPPAGSADAYVDAVLEHNHELARARRQADVLQAEAWQLAKRRSADPSVGVFYKNEVGGDEHVLGLNVGLTLPGAARRYSQQAAQQLSATAQDSAMRLEQRLRQEARTDFETAATQAGNWGQADRAAQMLEEAARLAARAYSLGEGGLDQVLLTRRLALDGRVQAQQAQVAALAADARLKLDAHELWPLDVHADDTHAHP
ncbi:MAG: TolC family protein [Thiobacillus sp.]|uniref:TolC family protein n=1 Tax=Thiobacillus sp. TaxID=924 RepID=UPI0027328273|nr:TolC family protein [Thiobacillus sp.]MDP3585139.1 TolC family protein [Thiobacillus sp.]